MDSVIPVRAKLKECSDSGWKTANTPVQVCNRSMTWHLPEVSHSAQLISSTSTLSRSDHQACQSLMSQGTRNPSLQNLKVQIAKFIKSLTANLHIQDCIGLCFALATSHIVLINISTHPLQDFPNVLSGVKILTKPCVQVESATTADIVRHQESLFWPGSVRSRFLLKMHFCFKPGNTCMKLFDYSISVIKCSCLRGHSGLGDIANMQMGPIRVMGHGDLFNTCGCGLS